jgi:hypothetical protein
MENYPELSLFQVYTTAKYPLLIDPTGQACQFLKYRGPVPQAISDFKPLRCERFLLANLMRRNSPCSRYLSILKKGDFEKETLRKALVQVPLLFQVCHFMT